MSTAKKNAVKYAAIRDDNNFSSRIADFLRTIFVRQRACEAVNAVQYLHWSVEVSMYKYSNAVDNGLNTIEVQYLFKRPGGSSG